MIDAHLGDADACGCCGHTASQIILNEMVASSLERTALDYGRLEEVRRTEDNDAPFVPSEIKLTEILAENAIDIADDVEAPILEALDRDYVDADRVTSAAKEAASLWENKAWPTTTEAATGIALSGAVLTGSNSIPFSPELGDVDRLRIINGMIRSARYTTNNYFNTQVMPALIDAVNSAVLNGTANDLNELSIIRQMLDRRLRSVPYWNVVANAASSRAYHYGYLKAGVAKGWPTVEYTAVIDSATSEICQTLHGTQWKAADVALFTDRIADAVDTDEVKIISPWLRVKDIDDWSPQALLNKGVVVPPIHGRCRSRLKFV